MQPDRMTCFCPRAATNFFKQWLSKHKDWEYDFFTTPEAGAIIFERENGIYRIKFKGRWFITRNFVQDMAESLAMGFGWRPTDE